MFCLVLPVIVDISIITIFPPPLAKCLIKNLNHVVLLCVEFDIVHIVSADLFINYLSSLGWKIKNVFVAALKNTIIIFMSQCPCLNEK